MAVCLDKGLDLVEPQQKSIRRHVETIQEAASTVDPLAQKSARRQSDFDAILARLDGHVDPIRSDPIHDNLDRERWFRLPKGHESRIHNQRHAGARIVQEGPTLVHALDAHHAHPEPFGVAELLPCRWARAPASQRQAIHPRKVLRKARSKTKRPK